MYTMSIFLLPKVLCNDLARMLAKFWWRSKENNSKIQCVSWRRLGAHKCNGGMWFRGLECFNKALLAKQLWRLLTQPMSFVATILRDKYCKYGNFLEAKTKGYHSLLWKNLLAAREVLKFGLG